MSLLPDVKLLLSENMAIYQNFTSNINVFLTPGDTEVSPSNS